MVMDMGKSFDEMYILDIAGAGHAYSELDIALFWHVVLMVCWP